MTGSVAPQPDPSHLQSLAAHRRAWSQGVSATSPETRGFPNFENYRIRALLYAGESNWRVLGSIVVR